MYQFQQSRIGLKYDRDFSNLPWPQQFPGLNPFEHLGVNLKLCIYYHNPVCLEIIVYYLITPLGINLKSHNTIPYYTDKSVYLLHKNVIIKSSMTITFLIQFISIEYQLNSHSFSYTYTVWKNESLHTWGGIKPLWKPRTLICPKGYMLIDFFY